MWGITWACTAHLIYSPLLLGVLGLLLYRLHRVKQIVAFLADGLQGFSWIKQWLKLLLFFLAFCAIFCAFLRPQWGKKEERIAQQGRDLFIALDISKSMLAHDVKPNRLKCAQQKIKQLVQQLSCERVGLILFSGSAFVQCPLTSDYAAFYMFLDQLDVETISSGATALDQAIMYALRAFNVGPERKNKLLVIVTDGEDFSQNLTEVAHQAAQERLHIFTLGVGTKEGAPIPLVDMHGKSQGHQKDSKGAVVISRLNEQMLSKLAHDCGGTYITMSNDDSDVRKLLKEVASFEKETLEDKKVTQYHDQYPYFVAVAFFLLALEWIL
ncbi:MAG: VWA domain-containing protein [Candidatus Babeliales bacterium]